MRLIGNTGIEFDKLTRVDAYYNGRNSDTYVYGHHCKGVLITTELNHRPTNTLRMFYGLDTECCSHGSIASLTRLTVDGQEIPVGVCKTAPALYAYLTDGDEERNTL